MRYVAGRTDIIDPEINSPEWDKASEGYIDKEQWSGFAPIPNTEFKILRGPEGISVRMHTDEKNLKAVYTEKNSMVCRDSCMEFFFKPDPWSLKYFNFEFNPLGTAYIAVGSDRYDREKYEGERDIFSIVSQAQDGDWTVKFYIPDEFVYRYCKNINHVIRANLYKCGDETDHQHYGMWAPVEVLKPDFHVPDFFGKIEL